MSAAQDGEDSRVVSPAGPLRGVLTVPGDKSISHRALLFNTLATGTARITGLLNSEDVAATASAVVHLGARLDQDGDAWVLTPPAALQEPEHVVDCGNSGTSIRLLSGLVAAEPVHVVLTGDASLRGRPMGRVATPLRAMGARIDGRQDGKLAPLSVRGGDLHPTSHDLTVASAQVKSCLLLAGRHVGVSVREPRQSRDHTERLLTAMGAQLRKDADGWLHLAPIDALNPVDIAVPGDPSAAAFWLVAASLVPGSDVLLRGVGVNPTRTGALDALVAMGAAIERLSARTSGAEPVADLHVTASALRGTRISGDLALRALDELPVLAVAAACANGETIIADAQELRVKESDRISRVVAGLSACGVEVQERPDGMVIAGGGIPGGGVVDASRDHRIAMAFAVAAQVAARPITVIGASSIRSSYPRFWRDLDSLTTANE